MITLFDEYHENLEGGFFSSYLKNLGNKLFIYAGCRIIADLLDYNLIVPEKPLIRRELNQTGLYVNEVFPFRSVLGRKNVTSPIKRITDNDIVSLGSIDKLISTYPNHGFENISYFSKYDYIKPYKHLVKEYYNSLVLPKRNNDDIIIMLRNSKVDGRFVLPDNYYLDILKNETFSKLYISLDHLGKHQTLLKKLEIYNPIILDGGILEIFSEITSFNKIIASQGTFSFWACLLSNADKIYWPLTNDGPNSNNELYGQHVNLIVNDEPRYEFIKIDNIYS